MTRKAYKLLERMRASKAGWKQRDLFRLYTSFGFLITHGHSHDIIKHSTFTHLRTTLPRHNELAKAYIEIAVRLVDESIELQKALDKEKEQSNGTQAES